MSIDAMCEYPKLAKDGEILAESGLFDSERRKEFSRESMIEREDT